MVQFVCLVCLKNLFGSFQLDFIKIICEMNDFVVVRWKYFDCVFIIIKVKFYNLGLINIKILKYFMIFTPKKFKLFFLCITAFDYNWDSWLFIFGFILFRRFFLNDCFSSHKRTFIHFRVSDRIDFIMKSRFQLLFLEFFSLSLWLVN